MTIQLPLLGRGNGRRSTLEHTTALDKKVQTFNADFTTAHVEHTDRNGMVGVYSGRGDRWATEIKVGAEKMGNG